MIDIGGFAFAAPWMLAALVIVPLIWWLLRITPPTPAHVLFPAVRLLFGLMRDEETPAKTPPWLIVLRMAIATLVILALAEPLLNPGVRLEGEGDILVGRPESLRDDYVGRFLAHRAEIAAFARAAGWNFAVHHTDRPAQTALLALYLAMSAQSRW